MKPMTSSVKELLQAWLYRHTSAWRIYWSRKLSETGFVRHLTVSEGGTGPFYGRGYTRIETRAHQVKKYWSRRYSPNGAPQAPSNKFSPAEVGQGIVLCSQLLSTNARWQSGRVCEQETLVDWTLSQSSSVQKLVESTVD